MSPRHRMSGTRITVAGLVLACGMCLVAPAALGTTARLTALGGRSDFFTDDANTTRWCASLADYPDQVLVDSGHFGLRRGYHDPQGDLVSGPGLGLHAKLDKKGRWGTVGLLWHGRRDDTDPGSLHHHPLKNDMTGLFARRFGRAILGVRYSRADGTTNLADLGGSSRANLTTTAVDWGAGARIDLGARILLDLDGSVQGITQQAPTNILTPRISNPDSWRSFALRGRAFIELGKRLILVPMGAYTHEDLFLPANLGHGPELTAIDRDLVILGLGANLFPDPDQMLIVSGEGAFAWDNARDGLPADSPGGQLIDQTVVMRLAYERRLNFWLTARASVGLQTVTIDSPTGNQSTSHAPVAMGLSASLAGSTLDMAVSDRLPETLTRLAVADPLDEHATWWTLDLRYRFRR